MACLLWVNVVSGICARVRHQLSRFNGYARVFATGERTNCIAAKQGCVCVCTLLITCSLNIDLAGECGMIVGPHSTKLPQSWDTGSDQPSVPASEDSNRLS